MSAGTFLRAKYEASADNGGGIYPIRVQPETVAMTIAGTANAEPAGAIDQFCAAKVRKATGEYGLGARGVVLAWTGTPPTGYSGDPVRVAVLTAAAFADYTIGATGTYLGAAVEVISRQSETAR